MLWVPISVLAAGLTAARTALSLGRGRLPDRLAAWSILRPRRYDDALAAALLDAVRREAGRLRVAETFDLQAGRVREPRPVRQERLGTQ
jgi:hypothetical protein